MSEIEKYKIEVYENHVEITGTLTIREAFDFLNFFEREGYTTLEDYGDGTTLYMKKRDLEKEKECEALENAKQYIKDKEEEYDSLSKKNKEQFDKIIHLEQLIKNLMSIESGIVQSLNNKISFLEKKISITNLNSSGIVKELLKEKDYHLSNNEEKSEHTEEEIPY